MKSRSLQCSVRVALSAALALAGACASSTAQVAVQSATEAELIAAKASEPQPDETIEYTGGGERALTIDVFRPVGREADELLPALVLYFGGGWKRGDPSQFYRQARFIADRGFIVLTPMYSVEERDGATPWDALTDAFLAFDKIVSEAEALGIDRNWIAAGGGSAGGQLAAALATVPEPVPTANAARPKALVLFNPVIDNGPDGYGYDRVGDNYLRFSPIHNIKAPHPPALFMVGDQDPLIPQTTAHRYCEFVEAAGSRCVLKIYEGFGHSWFNNEGFIDTLRETMTFLSETHAASGD